MGIRSALMFACTSALVIGSLLTFPIAALADEVLPSAAPIAAVASAAISTPPQDVVWKKGAVSSARLSWTAAVEADGSDPHYYIEVTFDQGEPFSIADTTETSANIKLQPGVSAKATITDIAQNTSATSEQYTQPAIASEAPKSANATARDMNYASKPPAVRAVWMPPKENGGTEIKQYRVQLFAGKGSSRQLVDSSTVGADTFSHTFSNLEFETFYAVEVSAINSVGASKVTKSNQVKTVAEPKIVPKPTVASPTSSPTFNSASTPSPSVTVPEATAVPSPAPSAQPSDSQLLFVAILPIIVLLLIAAIIALVFVIRYNHQVDTYNQAREVRDADQDF